MSNTIIVHQLVSDTPKREKRAITPPAFFKNGVGNFFSCILSKDLMITVCQLSQFAEIRLSSPYIASDAEPCEPGEFLAAHTQAYMATESAVDMVANLYPELNKMEVTEREPVNA